MTRIKAIEVRLDVADVRRSVAFYVDALGFELLTLWPDTASQFAILGRDGVRLQLALGAAAPPHVGCSLWLDVEDIGAWHGVLAPKARIEWGPQIYAYGRCEFALRDPDGYLLILSEVAADAVVCREG